MSGDNVLFYEIARAVFAEMGMAQWGVSTPASTSTPESTAATSSTAVAALSPSTAHLLAPSSAPGVVDFVRYQCEKSVGSSTVAIEGKEGNAAIRGDAELDKPLVSPWLVYLARRINPF